jgi:hypothetical protein
LEKKTPRKTLFIPFWMMAGNAASSPGYRALIACDTVPGILGEGRLVPLSKKLNQLHWTRGSVCERRYS